ncbi:MAG: urate oxidase [Burkholderiales bacterium]|nr:urate oxidase [Phycisphaerae bacterium]
MSFELTENFYGKSSVRVTKVTRLPGRHELHEYEVDIRLSGGFEACYAAGDNTMVLPTDTMKNTVYALAAQHEIASPEAFAVVLCDHFLKHELVPNCQTIWAYVKAGRWQRLDTPAGNHPHAFVSGGAEKRTCCGTQTRGAAMTLEAGLNDLVVLKTTDSAFRDFIRDQYTTLPDSDDRIFATTINADWRYADSAGDFNATYERVRAALIDTFAGHKSLSVQQTLQAMGEAVLTACPSITEISIRLPNQHRIPVNLQPLGLQNKNEIFVTTSEPYGNIGGTISRKR